MTAPQTLLRRLGVIALAMVAAIGVSNLSPPTASAAEGPLYTNGSTVDWGNGTTSRLTLEMSECGLIGLGTSGSCAVSLGLWMRMLQDPNLVVSSTVDYRMQSALINFQRRHGITPEGAAGPLTRAAIQEEYNQRHGLTLVDGETQWLVMDSSYFSTSFYLSHDMTVELARQVDARADGVTADAAVANALACARTTKSAYVTAICGTIGTLAMGNLISTIKTAALDPNSCLRIKWTPSPEGSGIPDLWWASVWHDNRFCQVP